MSKRILSIILCLMMCVNLLPVTAFADNDTESEAAPETAEEIIPESEPETVLPEIEAEPADEAPSENEPAEEPEADVPAEDETPAEETVEEENHDMEISSEEAETFDASIVGSGTCGDNLTWVLDEDDTLTISGTGAMYDYELNGRPWYDVREEIKNVVIESGVTSIGNYAFEYCRSLTSVTIPEGVTSIGGLAFQHCRSLTSVTIPSSVTSIGSDAFNGCSSIEELRISNLQSWLNLS